MKNQSLPVFDKWRALMLAGLALLFAIVAPSPAQAQEIKLRNTADTCNAASTGALRYNNGTGIFEQCNGASWLNMGAGASGWTRSGSNVYLTTATDNVGIGSSVPQWKLDVEGSVYFGNGNIGVGSSVPSQKVDVIGTVKATAFIGDGSGLTGLPSGGGWTASGTNVYTTTSSNNVGIGSTAPAQKLDVLGNIYVNGNVGIGSTSPAAVFNINSAATTTNVAQIDATALTSGAALKINGPTGGTAGMTGPILAVSANTGTSSSSANMVNFSSTVKTSLSLSAINNLYLSTTVASTGGITTTRGVYSDLVDNTTYVNTDYGIYSEVSSGTMAKTLYGVYGSVNDTSTLASTSYGGYFSASSLGAATVVGGTTYGVYASTESINLAGATANVYGVYSTLYTEMDSGTMNIYGLYAANGTSSVVSGTATKYGLYIEPQTGATNNYGAYIGSNVGIGSTAPQAKLDVEGSAYFGNGNIGVGSSVPSQKIDVIGTVKATAFIGDGSGLTGLPSGGGWTRSGTNVYVTTSTDNVGIGSSVPTEKLHVKGIVKVENGAFYAPVTKLVFAASGYPLSYYHSIITTHSDAADGNNRLTFNLSNAASSGLDVMTLTGARNVGIGSTVPAARLDLVGSGTTSATASLVIRDSTAAATVTVQDIGNVGLGTTSPLAQLHVFSAFWDSNILVESPWPTIRLKSSNASRVWLYQVSSTGSFQFVDATASTVPFVIGQAAPTSALIIASNGNIGINSSVPQAKLDVEGSSYFGNGNIGVGSSAPSQKVDVIGTVKATAFIGDGSGLTGLPSGGGWTASGTNVYTTTSSNNVGIGTSVPIAALNVKYNNAPVVYFQRIAGSSAGNGYNTLELQALADSNSISDGFGPLQWFSMRNLSQTEFSLAAISGVRDGADNSGGMYFYTVAGGSAAARMAISSQGNVGIGLGTGVMPTVLFTVGSGQKFRIDSNGNVRGITGTAAAPTYSFTGDTTAGMYSGGSGILRFATGGSNQVTIDNNGNVGIGSSAPQARLDVEGSAYFGNGNIGVGSSVPSQKIDVIGTVKATAFIGDGSGLTGLPSGGGWTRTGTNVYVTTGTDNVGIGTSVPSNKLHVAGILEVMNGAFYSPVTKIVLAAAGYPSSYYHSLTTTHSDAADANNKLTFNLSNAASAGVDVMTLNGAGNVGIGTSVPAVRLDLVGSGTTSATASLVIRDSTKAAKVTVLDNGNVGIGTSAPKTLLHLRGAMNIGEDTFVNTGAYALQIGSTDNNAYAYFGQGINNYLVMGWHYDATPADAYASLATYFYNNDIRLNAKNVIMQNATAGNVGIGSSVPSQALDVIGTVKATAFIGDGSGLTGVSAGGWSRSAPNVYLTTSSDNVGIGASPLTKLYVLDGSGFVTGYGSTRTLHVMHRSGVLTAAGDNAAIVTNEIVPPSDASATGYWGTWSLAVAGGSYPIGQIAGMEGEAATLTTNSGLISSMYGVQGTLLLTGSGNAQDAASFFANSPGRTGSGQYTNVYGLYIDAINQGTNRWGIYDNSGAKSYFSGNVGINSSVPSQKVDVVGTVKATAFIGDGSGLTGLPSGGGGGWSRSAPNMYPSTITDNVGIGTSTPNAKLAVYGGNVGIGTTNTSFDLSFGGESGRSIGVEENPYWLGMGLTVKAGNAATGSTNGLGGALVLKAGDATGLGFSVIRFLTATAGASGTDTRTSSDVMRIEGPKVGIGTDSPGSFLSVAGGVSIGTTYATLAAPTDGVIVSGNVGIGSSAPASQLDVKGSFAVYRTGTGASVSSAGETIIGVTSTAAPRTITLSTSDMKPGRILIVKDESGAAGTKNITVDTQGAETIDGQDSITITADYGVLRVYSNGSNWFTF